MCVWLRVTPLTKYSRLHLNDDSFEHVTVYLQAQNIPSHGRHHLGDCKLSRGTKWDGGVEWPKHNANPNDFEHGLLISMERSPVLRVSFKTTPGLSFSDSSSV